MRPSRVRQRWQQSHPALCTQVALIDPDVCEIISGLGYDCIWLDLEHHHKSLESAAGLIRVARLGGTDVLARPGKGEFMRMARLLEAGAHGILYPRCDSEEEAREVVRWMKFAPLGERGVDGGNADNRFGAMDTAAYIAHANAQTFLMLQIESPAAVEEAAAIAKVDGVDALFFGPCDFAVMSGLAGKTDHKTVRAARDKVCRAALDAGKRFGTMCFDADDTRRVLEMGASFVAINADRVLLRMAYEKLQLEMMELGFRFVD